jgi:hypothetical protein
MGSSSALQALFADERPKFVALYVAHLQSANTVRHDSLCLLASFHQQLKDRRDVDISQARNTGNAVSFEKQLEDQFCLFDGQVHSIDGSGRDLRVGPAAGAALKRWLPLRS